MSQQRLGRLDWFLLATSLASGAAALLLVLSPRDDSVGVLLGMIAATKMVVLTLRRANSRLDRAFAHGYHAGFHTAAAVGACPYPRECDVLDLAAERARRIR